MSRAAAADAAGADALRQWQSIVELVEARVAGATAEQLDRPVDEAFTLRELVHHVVEANVVAASIVVAGLGSPGCVYDWSWMLPFGPWVGRMGYREKPVEPALRLLRALNGWVVAMVEPLPDALQRTVQLRDAPGAALRTVTVADVLRQEATHANEHFAAGPAAR